jgi:hypothetical protein
MVHRLLYQVRRDKPALFPMPPSTTEFRLSTITRAGEEEEASFAAAPAPVPTSAVAIEVQSLMILPEVTPPITADPTPRHIRQVSLSITGPWSIVDLPRAPHRRPCSLVTLGTRQAQLPRVTRHQPAEDRVQLGQQIPCRTPLSDPSRLFLLVLLHLLWPLLSKIASRPRFNLVNSYALSVPKISTSIRSFISTTHALPSSTMLKNIGGTRKRVVANRCVRAHANVDCCQIPSQAVVEYHGTGVYSRVIGTTVIQMAITF